MAGRWHSNHVDTTLGMLRNVEREQLKLNQMNRGVAGYNVLRGIYCAMWDLALQHKAQRQC